MKEKHRAMSFILIGIIMFFIAWFIGVNNKLVELKNSREQAFAEVNVQLKQRHDLVSQLLDAVNGYFQYESELLLKITNARKNALSSIDLNQQLKAEQELAEGLNQLYLQLEKHPEIKSSALVKKLQLEIDDLECKIAAVRRYFNSATKELNATIEQLPGNFVAGYKKMTVQPLFEFSPFNKENLGDRP